MRLQRRHGGFTILEALIAMALLTIGIMGMMSLNTTGQRINADARQMTRATAIAQDLLGQIMLWDYDDARLAAGATGGADIADDAHAFEGEGPTYDHSDGELWTKVDAETDLQSRIDQAKALDPDADVSGYTAQDVNFYGIPNADVLGHYQRYWNVSYEDDSNDNGIWDGVRIAVIVRWKQSGSWRRVVLTGFKPNAVE